MTLKAWFEKTDKPVAEFAREIGRNRGTVYKYVSGALQPRRSVIHKIVEITGGDVTVADLVSAPAGRAT